MLEIIFIPLWVLFLSKVIASGFLFLHNIAILPFRKLSELMLESIPEGSRSYLAISYLTFSKVICYYLAGIWSAFMVYWIIILNSPDVSWWLYGVAFGGFVMARCVDAITTAMFIAFCVMPELIDLSYGWVPFELFTYNPFN